MRSTRLSNTAEVKVSDRAVVGPQPDQTPATGGTNPGGGGGGAVASVQGTANRVTVNGTSGSPQTGVIVLDLPQDIDIAAAVQFSDLLATSSILTSIAQAQRYNFPLVALAGSGTFTINLGNQNRTFINASGAVTIALASIAPEIPNVIIVHNNTGGAIAMTYPAWVVANGATLPATLAAGAWLFLELQPTGVTPADVVVVYSASSPPPPPPISTYLPTTGPLHSRLRKAIPGTIAGAGDMVWTNNTWFSVFDYGAVGDGVTDDTAAITAAGAAAAAAHGTLYFPDGVYLISDRISIACVGTMGVIGNSRHSCIILQSVANKQGLYFDLSGGTPKRNRVTVRELGFRVTATIKALDAIYVDYGATAIISSENVGGCVITGIDINNASETDYGGWTYGITMSNAWHWSLHDVYGYGGLGWNTASSPGAGDGTYTLPGPTVVPAGGSGCMIRALSGANFSIGNIQGNAWSQFIRNADAGLATPFDTQGALINHVNCVTCMEFLHAYAGPGGGGVQALTLTNFQCDNGNGFNAGYSGIVLEGNAGDISISNGFIYQDGGVNILKLDSMSSCIFSSILFKSVSHDTSSHHIYSTGTANVNIWTGCAFVPFSGAFKIRFDASAGLSQMNNIGGATFSDAGIGNTKITTLF